LTYSPPLNPSTDEGILNYSRDYLLPKIRADFKKNGGQELFDYGNTERRDNAMRWATFEEYPRYVTNYNGIRNRIPILSEAASFQPFSLRVDATLRFVKMVLDNLSSDSKKVIDLCRNADKRMVEFSKSGKEVGIRFAMDQRGNEKVILEKPDPQDPVEHNKAPKHFQEVEMPVYDRFKVVKTAKFPTAYLFPASFQNVADLLVRQGAKVERLKEDWQAGGDFFEIKEAEAAGQAFQGHKLIRLEGEFHRSKAKFDKGSFVVRSGQPLGLLIFHMLEPESLDGAIAWGFFGEGFKVGDSAPMTKVFQHVDGKTGVFPGKD
jgi:dipeptidyl-peptidase-4